jgi:glycosyltransferase involved in cell wall biosynthesis
VIIPTRNRADLLRQALGSAIAQEDVRVVVIIVDDYSAVPVARSLKRVGGRIDVMRLREHSGVAAARNTGLAAAETEWVAFLDDDDLWSPTKLRKQLDSAMRHEADWAYCGALMFQGRRIVGFLQAEPAAEIGLRLLVSNGVPAGGSSVIARVDLLRSLGGFDERFSHLDDWDAWIRLAQAASAAAVREPLVGYRLHPGNRLVSEGSWLREIDQLVDKHRSSSAGLSCRIDRAAVARGLAWRYRVDGRRGAAARLYLASAVRDRSPLSLGRALAAVFGETVWPVRQARGIAAPEWLTATAAPVQGTSA